MVYDDNVFKRKNNFLQGLQSRLNVLKFAFPFAESLNAGIHFFEWF